MQRQCYVRQLIVKKKKKKVQCDTPIFVVAQKINVFEKFSQQLLITKGASNIADTTCFQYFSKKLGEQGLAIC